MATTIAVFVTVFTIYHLIRQAIIEERAEQARYEVSQDYRHRIERDGD